MKKHLIWLTLLIPFVVGWIIYSFTVLQPNPLKWTQEARNIYIVTCFFGSIGIALFIPMLNAINSHFDYEMAKGVKEIFDKYYPRGR